MSACPTCGGQDNALAWEALNDAWVIAYSVQFSAHRVIVGSRHFTREQYGSIAAAFIAASQQAMTEYTEQAGLHDRFDSNDIYRSEDPAHAD